jgi:peptidoglycan/xylan/chitin deacetylase (PgdA/CDA1 family)
MLLTCATPPRSERNELAGRGETVARRDRRLSAAGPGYAIARWHGFHAASCSLTFDDGTLDQYRVAFPELEAAGLKATFFVITGPRHQGAWNDGGVRRLLFDWDAAREMARAGHEIASHSARHPDLSAPGAPVADELTASRAELGREIRSLRGATLAWPFWRSVTEARGLAARDYIGARSGTAFVDRYAERGGPTPAPRDPYDVPALAAITSATDDEWAATVDWALERNGWFVANFHGVDDGIVPRDALGWEPLPLPRFRAALAWLAGRDLWIAPFGRVLRYIRERDRAIFVRDQADQGGITARLLDGLDDTVYDQALTIATAAPAGWQAVEVFQDGVSMPAAISSGRLVFDALPSGTPIVIRPVEPVVRGGVLLTGRAAVP